MAVLKYSSNVGNLGLVGHVLVSLDMTGNPTSHLEVYSYGK